VVAPPIFDEISVTPDYTDNGANIDYTFNLNSTEASDIVFPTGTLGALYAGLLTPFGEIHLNFATPVSVGMTTVVEYWNGVAWTAMSYAVNKLVDDTNNFTTNGSILFDVRTLNDWSKNVTVSDYVNEYYWIRIRSSSNVTTGATIIQVSPHPFIRFGVFSAYFDTIPSFSIDSSGNGVFVGTVTAESFRPTSSAGYISSDSSPGATGSFTAGAQTVTVKDGIITSIV
jgi:hypothetical protein